MDITMHYATASLTIEKLEEMAVTYNVNLIANGDVLKEHLYANLKG